MRERETVYIRHNDGMFIATPFKLVPYALTALYIYVYIYIYTVFGAHITDAMLCGYVPTLHYTYTYQVTLAYMCEYFIICVNICTYRINLFSKKWVFRKSFWRAFSPLRLFFSCICGKRQNRDRTVRSLFAHKNIPYIMYIEIAVYENMMRCI